MATVSLSETPGAQAPLSVTASGDLPGWLARNRISLAVSTYQAGRLFLVGWNSDRRLSVFQRGYERCMGLCGADEGQTLWMSSKYQIWRLANALLPGSVRDGYDRVYVPRVGYTTGDVDTHDMAVDRDGELVFVATKFNCLATLSDVHSLRPLWRPRFISRLIPEDRCHLNGLAMRSGRARYVTAVAASDVVGGWRDSRESGGIVVDVESDEVIATGLSMPHSPRYHKGRLWVLNSGTGQFGHISLSTGQFEEIAFVPGFARGLAFAGDHALVGVSMAREGGTFAGLPLDEELARRGAEAKCGVLVIDLRTGAVTDWLHFDGPVRELYDVAVLPGTVRPMALGFRNEQIEQWLSLAEVSPAMSQL